jgi:hypothetical protein
MNIYDNIIHWKIKGTKHAPFRYSTLNIQKKTLKSGKTYPKNS